MISDLALIRRATDPDLRSAKAVLPTLLSLDVEELVGEYRELRAAAPRRGADGYRYFIPRPGRPPQSDDARRREEWLAMALWNEAARLSVLGETVDVLMYSFPLYTTGGPTKMRGVDLVGHAFETGRFWVIELKVEARMGAGAKRPYGETPLRALYEALVYGAVVEANMAEIATEMREQGRDVEHSKPGLLIAAPDEYWETWRPNPRIGGWWTEFQRITVALSQRLGTPIAVVSLGPISQTPINGLPTLTGALDCRSVSYH